MLELVLFVLVACALCFMGRRMWVAIAAGVVVYAVGGALDLALVTVLVARVGVWAFERFALR